MPTPGSIYTLTDPRDGTIRYVGKTTKPLTERLAGHLASPTNPAMRLWINTLNGQRLIPHIALVASVSADRLGAEEERHIRKHVKDGHRLFNAPYYHQHLHDITSSPALPAQDAPLAVGQPGKWEEFCRAQYEPIAKRRVAGQVSARRAALAVACRAVLVSGYALWQIRVVRWAAGCVVAGWYLLDIGFDRLAHEQLLARLPTGQAADFWRAYLNGPLSTLTLHLLALLYTYALMAYGDVRRALKPLPRVQTSMQPSPIDGDVVTQAAAALAAAPKARRP